MIRHRTIFPSHVSFHNWWVKSKRGVIGQLKKQHRDLRGDVKYYLHFPEYGLDGNGDYTTERLKEHGATIRRMKEELDGKSA